MATWIDVTHNDTIVESVPFEYSGSSFYQVDGAHPFWLIDVDGDDDQSDANLDIYRDHCEKAVTALTNGTAYTFTVNGHHFATVLVNRDNRGQLAA